MEAHESLEGLWEQVPDCEARWGWVLWRVVEMHYVNRLRNVGSTSIATWIPHERGLGRLVERMLVLQRVPLVVVLWWLEMLQSPETVSQVAMAACWSVLCRLNTNLSLAACGPCRRLYYSLGVASSPP